MYEYELKKQVSLSSVNCECENPVKLANMSKLAGIILDYL